MNTFLYFMLTLLIIKIKPIDAMNFNGYIVYCPCMGRFGNQADQFLGALGFAKGLNRTLVLPPWVEYRFGEPRSIQVPFDTYFQIGPLNNYTQVITMEKFMKTVASEVWPPHKRISFCYVPRGENNDCNAKEGNPFGSFWDTFNVDFIGSEFYEPLNYDVHHRNMVDKWNQKFPIQEWPVLAFTGTPGSFPIQVENLPLHKYLLWNDKIMNEAKKYINENLPKGGFIGIHLRNGVDWVRVCEHIPYSPNLFSAPQCVGYRNEKGKATQEMCMPTREIIVKQLKRLLKKMKNNVKSIFVASDSNHMIKELSDSLQRFNVTIHKLTIANPHVELAILGLSNHFVGNCISSFSAFVKRERDCNHLPSSFWAFPTEKHFYHKEEL